MGELDWKIQKKKLKSHCLAKAYQSILQKLLAEKYKLFQRTNQNPPQTNYWKTLISSKKKNNWAIHTDFSPCTNEVDKTRHISTRGSKKSPVVVKLVLFSNCKRYRVTATREKLQPRTWKIDEKTHSNNRVNYTHQKKQLKRSCSQFLSFMSEKKWAPGKKDKKATQKLQFVSSHLKPQAQFRHVQGTNEQVH